MPRPQMVTRTIPATICEATCVNLDTRELFTQELKLPRTYKNIAYVLKKAQELFNSENMRVVNIESYHVENVLYGQKEEDFINSPNTVILPPRNTKKEN